MLYGREEPLRAVAALLDRAHGGRGSGLVFTGVAGIGKTTVLEQAANRARMAGFLVRTTTGVPIEATLPYGALSALFASQLRDTCFEERFPALGAAIGYGATIEPPLVLEVASEALQWLSEQGRDRAVLLILDDVQWADVSSVAVLGHVARHAIADRLAVLVAWRRAEPLAAGSSVRVPVGEDPRAPMLGGITTLELQTLTVADATAALVAAGCAQIDAEQLAERSGGLPLAIAELGRRVAPGTWANDDIAALLPEAYVARVAALPSQVADAALCVAICADAQVLRSLGMPRFSENLRAAEKAGLLLPTSSADPQEHVVFRHPLLRAAVLANANPERERAIHRLVAAVLLNRGLTDRAALHLASAADGPDEEAADALAALAERARVRGALAESAQINMRAAALTAEPDKRSALLTHAADALFDSGDATAAFAAVDAAIDAAVDPRIRADAQSLRGRMSMWAVSPAETVCQLDVVANAMRPIDPGRAAAALAAASGVGYLSGDLRGAIARAVEAEALATDHGDLITAVAAGGSHAWNAFLAGDIGEFERRVAPHETLMRDLLAQRSWAGIHLAELFCTTWISAERWHDAEPLVRQLVHTTRTMGARLSTASATLMLGSLCWRRGRWDEAYALERPLLDDPAPPVTLCWIQALAAQLTATMGRADETRELVSKALPVATAADVGVVIATASAALGHLELSLGNDDAALAAFDRVATLLDRMGLHEPEYFLWQGDHIEALLRAGRLDEVRGRLDALAVFGGVGGRRWVNGIVARTRAQLLPQGDGAEADALFDEAIRWFEDLGMPFEVARTLLVRGGPQDRVDARRLFLQLGACIWAEAAASRWDGRERRSDSALPTPEPPRVLELLTPAERGVVLAVAAGRTNREIAAELHLSVKTVDHYLQTAFRRLGVRNRTELAIRVAREIDAPQRSKE